MPPERILITDMLAALIRTTVVALVLVAALLLVPAGPAHARPGDLDGSFGLDGKRIFGYAGDDHGRALVVQPDGKTVVAGFGGPDTALAVTRLNADGSFDRSFDGDGTAGADFGGSDYGQAVALQADGKIVVAGSTSVNEDIAVARFNADGSLDQSFDPGGSDGPGKKAFGYAGSDQARAVLVQPDGKIVVAGSGGANTAFAVTRLNTDGSFDNSFDGDGTAGADFGGDEVGYGVALQPDGRIVIAGRTAIGQDIDIAVARFKASGPADATLDETFDDDGKRTFGYGGTDVARAVTMQPDGKIVLAGYGGSNTAVAVTRLNPDGSFDTSFDEDGTSGADFGGGEEGRAVVLQPNGKIVVAGSTSVNGDFAVARLQPGGALDTTFSVDGMEMIDFGGDDQGYATALQRDGRIVLAGSTSVNSDIAVARLQGDPPEGAGGGPGGDGPDGGLGSRSGVPRCAGRQATIVGTAGRDRLRGTRRADVIVALGGNDRVSAAGGADLVCGGRGNDRLGGGRGPDRLNGGQGKDTLSGGPGRDRLFGGPQPDSCLGGSGRDRDRTCERRRSI